MPKEKKKEKILKGIPASPGIAIGPSLIIGDLLSTIVISEDDIPSSEIPEELERLEQAIQKTKEEISKLQEEASTSLAKSETRIFDVHLLIIDDKVLLTDVKKIISSGKQADYAFTKVINEYIERIENLSNSYIRERSSDIKDVASRLLSNLTGTKKRSLKNITGQHIIVANDLSPSETVEIDRNKLLAFIAEKGSRTSHTAILAQSLKIPAIVGVQGLLKEIEDDDLIIIDAFTGVIIINPTEKTLEIYPKKKKENELLYATLLKESNLRPETRDGFCIQLAANIESTDDIKDANKFGAAGVGLFRTEYIFMNIPNLPTEEDQFNIYREAAAMLNGRPLVIRTLDLGGDKLSDNFKMPIEPNPFLGLRAIRLCLNKPELLEPQIRAILRASVFGDIHIMFPMISTEFEVDQVLEIIKKAKTDLIAKGIPFNNNLKVGIMIEIPAAALIAEKLAKKVDFFSIGTNDLLQYTIAVDRCNANVSYLYQPTHPAVLRLIDYVVRAARKNNVWVTVCGEMASDPINTPILAGLGVNELSMAPVSLGSVRRVIRRIKMHEAEEIAKASLECSNFNEVLTLSENYLCEIVPDLMDLRIG